MLDLDGDCTQQFYSKKYSYTKIVWKTINSYIFELPPYLVPSNKFNMKIFYKIDITLNDGE